jgi:hypothetical protein
MQRVRADMDLYTNDILDIPPRGTIVGPDPTPSARSIVATKRPCYHYDPIPINRAYFPATRTPVDAYVGFVHTD